MSSQLISPIDAQNVIEHLLEAFALHEIVVDAQGRPVDYIFLAVNSAFETMTGLKGKDILGRRVTSVIPKLDPFWIETYGRVAQTGTSASFRHYDTQLHKWWQVTAFCPLLGRFAVLFRDITEEVRESFENKLYSRLNEALYQISRAEWNQDAELISAVLKVVVDLTHAREVIHHLHFFHDSGNQQDCFSMGPDGLAPRTDCEDLQGLDTLSPGAHPLETEGARALPSPTDWILVITNDRDCFHSVTFLGIDLSAFGFGLDVFRTYFHEVRSILEQLHLAREKSTLQQQFLHAQKLKSLGVQAGIVAHDFNNLLAAILGKIELLKVRSPGEAELRTELGNLQKLVLQGKDLTTQLLSFVGMDSLEMKEVEIVNFAHELEPLLRASVPRNIELVIDTQHLPPETHVWADSGRLRQAILNLAVNAADAIGELSGNITILFALENILDGKTWKGLFPTKPGEYIAIQVVDDGPGIAQDKLEKIFEPFFSTKPDGHGLGLSAVVNIVKEHRGNIRVESRPGQGTKFMIVLPRHKIATPRSVPVEAELDRCQDGEGPLEVLLIDDEPWLLEVNRETFECLGHRVSVASDGYQGLNVYRSGTFDLVCLDLTMPGMSGQELWALIKEEKPDQRFLILTGFSSQSLPPQMLQDTHTRFLQKPFELRALTEKLQELFGI